MRVHAPVALLERLELLGEEGRVDARNDLAVHLNQPAVVVEQEVHRLRVGLPDHRIAHAEVQDRLHHPRHGHGAAGADGDEQRIRRVTEALAGALLEQREVLLDLRAELGRKRPGMREMVAACFRGDREPERDRQAERRHLGEAQALAAEQVAATLAVLVEVVDQLGAHVAHLPRRIVPVVLDGQVGHRRDGDTHLFESWSGSERQHRRDPRSGRGNSRRALAAGRGDGGAAARRGRPVG